MWRGFGDLFVFFRGWGGRGVDRGIRVDRRFFLDFRVGKFVV